MAVKGVVDFNTKKYDINKIYPEGTVLWSMRGKRQNDAIIWSAYPYSIESYDEGGRFYKAVPNIIIIPSVIGKVFFLTRQEALDRFLENHHDLRQHIDIDKNIEEILSKEEADKVSEFPRTNFQNIEICESDTVSSAAVYLGHLTDLEKVNDKLIWRNDKDVAEKLGIEEARFLSLNEIYEQVKKNFGKVFFGILQTPLITVIVNDPLKGTIYQCNNHCEGIWEKLGETKGYA